MMETDFSSSCKNRKIDDQSRLIFARVIFFSLFLLSFLWDIWLGIMYSLLSHRFVGFVGVNKREIFNRFSERKIYFNLHWKLLYMVGIYTRLRAGNVCKHARYIFSIDKRRKSRNEFRISHFLLLTTFSIHIIFSKM